MTVSNPHQLGGYNRDWLLTLLAVVLILMTFVFAPLQAADIFVFQTFAIAGLLPIIAGVLIISGNPITLGLLSIAHSLPVLSSIFGIESIIGQLYPATILARLVTLELKVGSE